MDFVTITAWIIWILTFLLCIHIAYFTTVSLFFLKRIPRVPPHSPVHRFAAIIAARNERDVIGNLVESLKAQNYPKELFDIIVVPNNCADDTKTAAEQAGAAIVECPHKVHSKGDVLTFIFNYLLNNNDGYDAFCVFDADNVVHKDFLYEMNKAYCNGSRVAQGYRDSKNPADTFISACYSIYYWGVNRFYNHTRSALDMSVMINGSGFMIAAETLRKIGGWRTYTMTEDLEFTAQCALRGIKIDWVSGAIIYDEQPTTFLQSWVQRKRWSTGIIQGCEMYSWKLFRKFLKNKNICCLDMSLFFLSPLITVIFAAVSLLSMILNIAYILIFIFPDITYATVFEKMFISFNFSYVAAMALSLLVIILEHKKISRVGKGVLGYWIFITSWIPINLICLFKRVQTWEEIKHSRNIKISEIEV